MKNSMAIPSKIKNRITIQSNNSTSGHIQKNWRQELKTDICPLMYIAELFPIVA